MAELEIRVQPGARRNGFIGWYGDVPKLAVTAPPVDGAANAAVTTTLAKLLGVPRRRVRLVSGVTSRMKRVAVDGVTEAELAAALERLNRR